MASSVDNRSHGDGKVEEDIKFPYKQLGVLAFCRLAEPIAFNSITAYSFVMVQHIKGEENASFYSGLLISAFTLAEACTTMIWGTLSDRYGRKPIILFGLAGTAISSLAFGFSNNYWLALLARVVGGLLNGNVAVMQTTVSETVKKPEHEPRAYTFQPFMWSLGSIAGAALGGFTAEPTRYHPTWFSEHGIFGKYPYLLPNLIAVAIIVAAMIQGYLFLEETNAAVITQRKGVPQHANEEVVDETTSLVRTETHSSHASSVRRRTSSSSPVAVSTTDPLEPSFDIRRSSFTSIKSIDILRGKKPTDIAVIDEEPAPDSSLPTTKPVKVFNKKVILWIINLALMSYHQMGFGALLPVYMLDSPRQPPKHLDLQGGLGKTLPDVGSYLAVRSVFSLFNQAIIFPIFVQRLGVWHSAASLTIFAPLVYIATPFISLLPNPSVGIYIIMILQNFCCIIISPSLLILLKNDTESPAVLGQVNGLAMSLCSASRTIAPPLGGIIYSTIGSAAAWWSQAVFAAFAVVELCFIQRPQSDNKAVLRKASVSA